jgi:hypothetical protein
MGVPVRAALRKGQRIEGTLNSRAFRIRRNACSLSDKGAFHITRNCAQRLVRELSNTTLHPRTVPRDKNQALG